MDCSLFLISESLASEFRASELSQGQGITALGELDLFECAHTQEDCLAPHARSDACRHPAELNLSEGQPIDRGGKNRYHTGGSVHSGSGAVIKAKIFGQACWHCDISSAGIQQEGDGFAVNSAC